MSEDEGKPAWICSADLRISHPELDPQFLSRTLGATPTIAQLPGESRVRHGDCKSAGYWCIEYKVQYPDRPDVLILWAEEFIAAREADFISMLDEMYDVNFYLGIHSNVLALGFKIPPTPTLWRLGIPLGIEYFSR